MSCTVVVVIVAAVVAVVTGVAIAVVFEFGVVVGERDVVFWVCIKAIRIVFLILFIYL